MTNEDKIMGFLEQEVFAPVLNSTRATESLKQGVRLTMTRMRQKDAVGMIKYFWSAIDGTERSTRFAAMMQQEGFKRFEDVRDEFHDRFSALL